MSTKKNLFLQKKHCLNPKAKSSSKNISKSKKLSKVEIIKGPWSLDEDNLLKSWIEKNGPKNWTKCALNIPGRTGKQCREHWNNSLNYNIKKGDWSSEEDYLIMVFYEKYKGSWKKMIPIFKSRTENSIKNRFFSQIRKIASRYIKTGKKEYSTKFGLNILLNYYKMGVEEAKIEFLKNNSMNEKELEEYINNIDKMVNNKTKEEKFIDIQSLRKDKNNLNDNIIDKNENKFIDKELDISKENKKVKIKENVKNNKNIKEVENKEETENQEELKTYDKSINIIINNDNKEIDKNLSDKNKKEEEKNKTLNKPEISSNKNPFNNITNEKNIFPNNGLHNINYSINNTITYNINNNYNNNNNINMINNLNMNNYMNNPNENYFNNQNFPTNQANSFNNYNNIFCPLNLKNTSFFSGSNTNLNSYKNDKSMNFYTKKSSDLSEYFMNNENDQGENNQKQNEISTTPNDVYSLLNAFNSPIQLVDNNYKYIKLNSGIIENPGYFNNNNFINNPNNKIINNNLDDKNILSPTAPTFDKRFLFSKEQANNFTFNRHDSFDNIKGAFSNQKFYGYNRMASFGSVKDLKIINNDGGVIDESNKK